MTRLVCISDTHNRTDRLVVPDGDVLLHAGDLTGSGDQKQIEAFNDFLGRLPHTHKVMIAGNHDFLFEREPSRARALIEHAIYLEDSEATVCGLRIWGSPWQPWFHDWAFNLSRGAEIAKRWSLIPAGVDVLMTHGPPLGHGDLCDHGERVGCADLLAAVQRVKPRLHIFGHIHEAYGVTSAGPTTFVNASTCDIRYRPLQAPIVIDWLESGVVVLADAP